MKELIEIAYRSFMDDYDAKDCKAVRLINESWEDITNELDKLREILSDALYDEAYDKITDGAAEVQRNAFIVGFAYCAKFLSNGKSDLFPDD